MDYFWYMKNKNINKKSSPTLLCQRRGEKEIKIFLSPL
jgi:hypothetical protein